MSENRFFTFIWRFNGLVIALAVTLLLGILIWELTRALRRTYLPTRTSEVITAPSAAEQNPAAPVDRVTRFGSPVETGSPAIYALPRYVEETYRNRGISKQSGGNLVNYLVIDTRDQSTRWLFDGDARLITDVRPLTHGTRTTRRFIGHVLHVIEEDSNGNGQLSQQDSGVLYFIGPDWPEPVRLSGDVKSVSWARAAGPDLVEMIVQETAQTVLSQFTLPDGAPALKMVLPD